MARLDCRLYHAVAEPRKSAPTRLLARLKGHFNAALAGITASMAGTEM
jgi:hypothetical protein